VQWELCVRIQSRVARTPEGVLGSSLLSLAGSVSGSDMAEIEAAIEEGCEKVNLGGW
jgi:hypothetical protein